MEHLAQKTDQQTDEPQAEASVKYAGFWVRALASLVDTIMLAVIITLPLTLIYGAEEYSTGEKLFLGFWDIFLGYIVPVLLTIWFWMRFLATPGKMLFGVQVVDAETLSALTVKQSIIRYVGYLPAALVIFIGLLWIAFDRRKQGWHDKLAGSVAIRKAKTN